MSDPEVCILKPSPNFDARKDGERDISFIVLFDTGSNNCCGDLARLRNPASGVGSHYLVDREGRIYQLVADKDRAWCSVRDSQGAPQVDLGEKALVISLVNDGSGYTPYPAPQYRALLKLVKRLMARYGIPPNSLDYHEKKRVRHAGRLHFDLESFRQETKDELPSVFPPEPASPAAPLPAV